MANAAGGHYHAQGARPQFPAYASPAIAGHYYPPIHQQQQQQQQQRNQQPLGFQYYAPPPPQPPAPPGVGRYGVASTTAAATTTHQQYQYSNASHQYQQQQPPSTLVARNPPPPPPPGESPTKTAPSAPPNNKPAFTATTTNASTSLTPSGMGGGGYIPPLQPPPLPPMFPWMSAALAESMTSSQFGQNFREEASHLPFVPIIVNDSDLAKMTENVKKEAEQVKSHQLQYYRDVMNQDLPQSLKDMFQPLYCKLCTLTLSSPVVAKDHYSGKRHKKAVEGWMVKYPHLSTAKQRKEMAGAGAPQQQPASGCVVKTPGGGLGLTGPINGYIMKHNSSSNQHQPSIMPKPSPPVAAPAASLAPPSLLSLNFDNNNRKRPAPSAPTVGTSSLVQTPGVSQALTSPVNNTQSQSTTQSQPQPKFIGPQRPTDRPDSTPANTTPTPPPQNKPIPAATAVTTSIVGNESVNNSKPPVVQQNQNQGLGPPPPKTTISSNPDFQAKRPRRDDESGGKPNSVPVVPVVAARQPGEGPQQRTGGERERGSGGSGNGGGPPPKRVCELCNVQLSSKVMAEQHFNGKNHKAKLAALQDGSGDLSSSSNSPAPPIAPTLPVPTVGVPIDKPVVAPGPSSNNKDNNSTSSIASKLLALSSQSSLAPAQQISPPDVANGPSFGGSNIGNPFLQQQFNKPPRGGGAGGSGGHRGGRGGGQQNNNRGGGGGRGRGGGGGGERGRGGGGGGERGRGGGGGGPPFRNNNANNRNNNNFNANNRFNNNNRGRGR